MILPPPECVKEMKVEAQRDLEESVSEVLAAESKLQPTVSNQGHEWNVKVQGKTLQLPSR